MGDKPIEPEYRRMMNTLAHALDDMFNGEKPRTEPAKVGFFLAVYTFGEEGRFNYISNSDRKDIVVLLKEMVARFEGQPEMKGRA